MEKILIVDDERSIRTTLADILSLDGYETELAENGIEALARIDKCSYDLVISDISMNRMSGIELFNKVSKQNPSLKFIIISGVVDIPITVDLIKRGVFDVIEKPIDMNVILKKVRAALSASKEPSKSEVVHKNTRRTNKKECGVVEMIGFSPVMQHIKGLIASISNSESRVLILGENGTGKELVAKMIHAQSPRANAPIIEVNCAAIPSELIESEMFGHERGAFTGAVAQKKGKFELANGGTLFLDEVGDMSLSAQAKVLRALQEGCVTPVGGSKSINVDVRVIAATNKNLKEEIKKGNFREDLYHRLSAVLLRIPPLREREGDVKLLVEHFMTLAAKNIKLSPDALAVLDSYSWSGNIRELQNVVERIVVFGGKNPEIINGKFVERLITDDYCTL